MRQTHAQEHKAMAEGQKARWQRETLARANRLRTGVRVLWDRMTGEHAKTIKHNELEAWHGLMPIQVTSLYYR